MINYIISACSKLVLKDFNTRLGEEDDLPRRKWNLTIRTNGIYTTKNLSNRMRRTNSCAILRYKQISNLGQTTWPLK